MTKQGLNTVMDFHGGMASGSGLGAPDQYTSSSRKKWEVSFTQEELRDLFSLREDTLCDTQPSRMWVCLKEGRRGGGSG